MSTDAAPVDATALLALWRSEEAAVRAVGNVIHLGSRTATADGRLTGPDGKLYAHASTTCFIFNTP